MRVRILLRTLALAVALSVGGEASACFYVAPIQVLVNGFPPTARQIERENYRIRRAQIMSALSRGVDVSAELAKMLVPNIRPVFVAHSDCGPTNDIDLADGEETIDDWLAGTHLAGYGERFRAVERGHYDDTLGPTCNAEFRHRFAVYLSRRLDGRQLRASYFFLALHWVEPSYPLPARRLVAFDGTTRRPPLRWLDADISRWAGRDPTGRTLQGVIDDFWRESAPLLERTELVCPAALAAWPVTKARIIAEIEAGSDFARGLRPR